MFYTLLHHRSSWHGGTQERQRLTPKFKADAIARMDNALGQLDAIMEEIPEAWKTVDGITDPHRLTASEIRHIMTASLMDEATFWKRVEGVS